MIKFSKLLAAAACLLGMGAAMFQNGYTKTYPADSSAFANAQIGYAPEISSSHMQGTTLRYLNLTWRELEPEEGVYAWDALEQTYGFAALREQGIHLVLRFVCDLPSDTAQLDIPDWLYEQTQDGSWYDTSYGRGYSPNYANAVFRKAHRKAIAALAAHFDDGFVSYVELGSLGHWGEWHIKSSEGLVPMPGEVIRNAYVKDYLDAFSNARLLMRRPFAAAAQNGLGLYNDMTGHEADTREWLGWIENGGWYGSEPNALTPMPDAWKTAPIGGEFTSSLSMKELLRTQLSRTLELVQASHMSFLGPLAADDAYRTGSAAVLKALGYRLRVTELHLAPAGRGTTVTLTLTNDGAAPFYWDWSLNLYLESTDGTTLQTLPLPLSLPTLLPGEKQTVTVRLDGVDFPGLLFRHTSRLTLGIADPMTGRDAVRFAMKTARRNGRAVLWP